MNKVGMLSDAFFGAWSSEGPCDHVANTLDFVLYVSAYPKYLGKHHELMDTMVPFWQLAYHGIILSNPFFFKTNSYNCYWTKSKEEIQAMLSEIQALQSELMAREDALFKAERDLQEKQNQLEAQNAKITELTALIEQQAQKMQDIKDKIQKALVGYEGDGLQIESRNGRIYVSLDEKLLFQSGKWNVDARGKKAIQQLSAVLAANKDIDILVEGHTDNVPYAGNGHVLDNWDLSVKRATAIVRILLENRDLEASRVMAAGRGEFNPIDTADTKEARQKNRRTEIILTPKLTELLQLFE
jgi:chemotaxis protein MotB